MFCGFGRFYVVGGRSNVVTTMFIPYTPPLNRVLVDFGDRKLLSGKKMGLQVHFPS